MTEPQTPEAAPVAPAPADVSTPQSPTPAEPAAPTPSLVVPPENEPKPDPAPQDSGDAPPADPNEPVAFEINVPETLSLDDASTAKLIETAREQNLTPEQTQALLDSVAPSLSEANDAYLAETREIWTKEIANDPNLGGDKLPENESLRDKAVEAFGDEGLKTLLNSGDLPLRDEPSVFRLLVKIGKAITEPSAVQGGATGASQQGKPITGDVFNNTDHAVSVMYGDKKD